MRSRFPGSIRQRADGRWEARATVDSNGLRVRRSLYGRTRREVADKLIVALHRGTAPPDRLTVGELLDGWLRGGRDKWRATTYERNASIVRLHLAPGLGSRSVTDLLPDHVERFLHERLERGFSPRTVTHLRAALRQALKRAIRARMVDFNAAALADPPSVPRYQYRVLSPREAGELLIALRGDRLQALYVVALATGLRQGELLGLRWEDVDLEKRTLAVRRALQRSGGKLVLTDLKTDRSRRTLLIPAVAHRALADHAQAQSREREFARDGQWVDNFVFTTSVGTPLDSARVTRRLQRIVRTAGIPRIRFHDLRHTCASFLVAQGVHPRVVMEQLGHSQISMTMDTYSHVLPGLQAEAAEQVDQILATALRTAEMGVKEGVSGRPSTS